MSDLAPSSSVCQLKRYKPYACGACVVILIYSVIPARALTTTGAVGTWIDVFQDPGVTYFVADRLSSGHRLYADVAYPYGPVPVWMWTAAAELGGNSPATYAMFSWGANLIFALLLYTTVSRAVGPFAALVVVGCGLPMPPPSEPPYRFLERCLFAGILITWAPPGDRPFRRAAVVGGLLGCWQWVKFGGAVYAAAALALVDLATLIAGRADRASIRHWLATTAAAAGVASLVEAGRVVWAYSTLPSEIATDVVWPMYIKSMYSTLDPLPSWYGWRHFAVQYLIPVSGLVATAVAIPLVLYGQRRSSPSSQASAVLLVPPLFFLLGIGTYLGYAYQQVAYSWCLLPPAAIVIGRWPQAATVVFLGVWLPNAILQLRSAGAPRQPQVVEILPRGHPVTWSPEYREAYFAAAAEWARSSHDPQLRPLVMPTGCGFYFLRQIDPPSRHTWLIPHFFRPYDEGPFLDGLDRVPFIVYVDTNARPIPENADLSYLIGAVFGPKVTEAIRDRVTEEIRVNSVCRIYRLRRGTARSQ